MPQIVSLDHSCYLSVLAIVQTLAANLESLHDANQRAFSKTALDQGRGMPDALLLLFLRCDLGSKSGHTCRHR